MQCTIFCSFIKPKKPVNSFYPNIETSLSELYLESCEIQRSWFRYWFFPKNLHRQLYNYFSATNGRQKITILLEIFDIILETSTQQQYLFPVLAELIESPYLQAYLLIATGERITHLPYLQELYSTLVTTASDLRVQITIKAPSTISNCIVLLFQH